MVISSKSNGIAAAASATTTTTIGGTKRKSKVPVSTSFSGLSKPRKPRGPRTPYNFFFADERAKMGEAESQQDAAATMAAIKQGGGTGTDNTGTSKPKPTFETTKARNREIAKKWRHFAQMQKLLGDNDLMKSYRAMAAEDEVRYKNEMAEYLHDVEAYNDAEAEAEEEFIQLQKRVIAEAHAKHGKSKKKKARVEENNGSSTNTNNTDNDEARVQPSLSGSPTNNNAGASSNNTTKDHQEPTTRGEEESGDAAAAAAMTNMASGLGLVGRTPLQNRIHPGPPRAAAGPHHPGVAAASPYYMHHGAAAPPPPPPQYHHPNMPYYYPGGMYTMPHMAHPPTLNALMAQRAGEAAAVHMPPSLPAQAVDDRISASMAYLQGYAAACSAMIDRRVPVAPTPAAQPTPAQGQQQPSASASTRSNLEKAVAVAGPVPTAAKVAAPSSAEEDAALLEESPLTQKKVDKDIFVARRRQGQKTTEE